HMAKWVCPSTKPGVTRLSGSSNAGVPRGTSRPSSAASPTARIRPASHQIELPQADGSKVRMRRAESHPEQEASATLTALRPASGAFHMLKSRPSAYLDSGKWLRKQVKLM